MGRLAAIVPRSSSARARARAALALAALCACTRLEELPAQAVITCGGAGDCPAGRVCSRGRCVDPAAIDTTPPDLAPGSAVTVTPARVRAGQPFTVAFEVTEPLAGTPDVSLAGLPAHLACRCPTPSSCACDHTPAGDENGGAGGVVAVDVRMTDLAGNETVRTRVAAVVLDFAPPAPTLASVAYDPAATNPLPSVARATGGTRVRVVVSADEPLGPTPPALVGRQGSAVLPFALAAGGAGAHEAVFVGTVTAADPDGAYTLAVTWSDEVGNSGTAAVPAAVAVKTSRPVLQVAQDALVFVRSPFGSGADEVLGAEVPGAYTIPRGPYFALEPADALSTTRTLPAGALLLAGGVLPSAVLVQDAADPAAAQVLGVLRPSAGALPRQKLVPTDRESVHLVGVDDAGNPSAAVRVRNAEWVATSYAGALGNAPHGVAWTPAAVAAREQRALTAAAGGTTAQADGNAVVASSALVWEQRTVGAAHPGARTNHALAYDPARGRVVLFGGRTPAQRFTAELWSWSGAGWADETPLAAGPGARLLHAMAHDAARGRIVVAGGYEASFSEPQQPAHDVWEWDGTRWQVLAWSGATEDAVMAYDARRGVVVLYSGGATVTEIDGATLAPRTPGGAGPICGGCGVGGNMAYDPRADRTVLVASAPSGIGSRTWEWNGTAWADVTPAGPVPAVGPVAYDLRRGRLVLVASGRTWERSAAGWSDVTPAGVTTPAGALAYDAARGRVVLVGSNVTWEWDGVRWRDVTPSGASPAVQGTMAYDGRRGIAVLVAGSQTWEWSGSRWKNVTPGGSVPTGGWAAYDAGRDRTVVVTGGRTWEWNGAGWTDVTPATAVPSSGSLAYDAWRQKLVLEDAAGVTWTRTGTAWATTASSPRIGGAPHPLAFDASRRVTALAPGWYSPYTWEWDGTSWRSVASNALDRTVDAGAFAFDGARGRAIYFGGSMPQFPKSAAVWEWDGATWRQATTTAGPSGRDRPAMTYEADVGRAVLFGGDSQSATETDTWVLDCSTTRTPAVQLDVSTAALGVPLGAVSGIRVRAFAGGAQAVGAATVPGAALYAWSAHVPGWGPGWLALDANTTPVAASAPHLPPPPASVIHWSSASAAEALRLVTQRDGRMAFQVRPLGPAGAASGGTSAALDFLEVRVRYALP